MSPPLSHAWFARHELRLAWRDWLAMMTGGKPRRGRKVVCVIAILATIFHVIAWLVLRDFSGAASGPQKPLLFAVSGTVLIAFSMMLSQALESVTRAFYARDDLELILASPAPAHRLFGLRIGAIFLATTSTALLLAAPVIDVLALIDGSRWLVAYAAVAAFGAIATGVALAITALMFGTIGPRRTRFIAQVLAAVVGAAFVIGIQAAAILSIGSLSRTALFRTPEVQPYLPAEDSLLWWPARAVLGDFQSLAMLLIVAMISLAAAFAIFRGRFAGFVLSTSSLGEVSRRRSVRLRDFRAVSAAQALRRKEWILLRRDPWLVSQTLMQILYLFPPALLLWRNFGSDVDGLLVLVPVIVMASGQLAGGLAWLAVSGEDAPDLVAGAPMQRGSLVRAKVEAVLGAIALVVTPLLIAVALASPRLAAIAALGSACAAAAATAIQLWFRVQARRSAFRRRQTSSRIATFLEAFSSISWAGVATVATMGSWLAAIAAGFAIAILFAGRALRPADAELQPSG